MSRARYPSWYTLDDGRELRSGDYRFIMRCWTRDELNSRLRLAGLGAIECFGAYDAAVPARATDRLVAVAQLQGDISKQV